MAAGASGWKVELIVPAHAAEIFAAALAPLSVATAEFEVDDGSRDPLWRVAADFDSAPDHAALVAAVALAAARAGVPDPGFTCAALPPTDWLAENRQSFRPLRAGRYFVHPTHFAGSPPAGAIPLALDAGTAFGSGEHATTRGCLLALDALARRRSVRRPLDLGCGSGILSIAMARTWRVPVVAADIDGEAVRVTRANARRNGVGRLVAAHVSNGFADGTVRHGAPYDLIAANILAGPLTALAHDVARYLSPGGIGVLSGLLAGQARGVAAAYRAQGLRLVRRAIQDGWATLVLIR